MERKFRIKKQYNFGINCEIEAGCIYTTGVWVQLLGELVKTQFDNTEWFEEIIEKDYEIIGQRLIVNAHIIYSVKHLPTNKIWSLGDETQYGKIKSFDIVDNKIACLINDNVMVLGSTITSVHNLSELKEPEKKTPLYDKDNTWCQYIFGTNPYETKKPLFTWSELFLAKDKEISDLKKEVSLLKGVNTDLNRLLDLKDSDYKEGITLAFDKREDALKKEVEELKKDKLVKLQQYMNLMDEVNLLAFKNIFNKCNHEWKKVGMTNTYICKHCDKYKKDK